MNDIQTFSRRADRITDGARRRVEQYSRRFKIIFDGWYNNIVDYFDNPRQGNQCLILQLWYVNPGKNPKERFFTLSLHLPIEVLKLTCAAILKTTVKEP